MLYGAMNNPVLPVLDELEEIAGLELDFFELTMDPPEAHYSQVLKKRDVLRSALDHHGLKLVCHMPTFVSLADLTDSLRNASLNEVLQSMETAAELEPLKMVVHPAHISGMGSYVLDTASRYAMESLAAIVDKSESLGIPLCLENMFPRGGFCVEPDDFTVVFKRFPDLQLTLDTGHANINSLRGKRIIRFIESFADRIGHVHVSDNLGKDDSHLPIGAGNIRFPEIIKALKRAGYEGTVTFEIFNPDRGYLKLSRDKFDRLWHSTY